MAFAIFEDIANTSRLVNFQKTQMSDGVNTTKEGYL